MPKRRDEFFHLAVMISLAALLVYLVARIALFLFAEYTWIEKFFAVVLLFGETFVLLHALGYILNMLRVLSKKGTVPEPPRRELRAGEEPSVAILVAARHEPRGVLEKTFAAIRAIDYPHKTIHFLDDSSDEEYKREAEEIAREFDLKLFRRQVRHGAKAGVINDILKDLEDKYVVIFDADQCPVSGFLKQIVPYLEADDGLSFVQTPQFYTNIADSRIGRASSFQQAVFYEYICEGKSYSDAMICCGTNVVIRRAALVEVGGFDEGTVTEDFATSFKLHQKGWRSLYVGHVSTFGLGPEDLDGYFKQQFRWAKGSLSVLKSVVREFIRNPRCMRPGQWGEYFLSGSYYLNGWAFFCLMVCPVVYLFFKIPSFFAHPIIYLSVFIPYVTLSMATFYMVLGRRSYRVRDLYLGQMLGLLSLPVLMRAAVLAFSGIKSEFGITSKGKVKSLSYGRLWPQLSLMFINFTAAVWGVNRFIVEREPTVIVSAFWVFYYFFLFSSIFYFNETDFLVLGCQRLPRKVRFDYQVLGNDKRLVGMDLAAWPFAFKVMMPELCPKGTLLMCKLSLGEGPNVVFDGEVLEASQRGRTGKAETTIGVTTSTDEDRRRIQELVDL